MSVQILHCSDPHLGKNFNISSVERRFRRSEDLERSFASAVDYALKNRPDIFLLTGDVFDRISPPNNERVFLAQMARKLRDVSIPFFMIGGNHDVPKTEPGPWGRHLAIDILETAGLAMVFSASDSFQGRTLKIDGKDVRVVGKSYQAQFEAQNPFTQGKPDLGGDYNILMLHASLKGLGVTPTEEMMASQNPFRPEDVPKGVNILALGHFHNSFVRQYRGCTIVNPGSMERMSWAEMGDEKGFAWIELKGSESSVEFVKLETRPMGTMSMTLSTELKYEPSVTDFVVKRLMEVADEERMVKLLLRGRVTMEQYNQLKIGEILEACRDSFFHLVIDRSDLEVEGYGRIFAERVANPVEAYAKRLRTLVARAQSDEERRHLEELLEIGTKYLEVGT
jgi:DNA repair exonuclease SbcCD nuclease subunit